MRCIFKFLFCIATFFVLKISPILMAVSMADENAIDVIQPSVDIARSIQSYEVTFRQKSTEIILTPSESTRDENLNLKIWCDLQKPEFVAIKREQVTQEDKKTWNRYSVYIYSEGKMRTNTNPSVAKAEKIGFDTFRSTKRLPYPELCGFGSIPIGLSDTKDSFLDKLLQVEGAVVKRLPDGTPTIFVRIEVEGIEATKSLMFDKRSLSPTKVSMNVGDFWTQVCAITRHDVNDVPVPKHIRISTDQKDPKLPNGPHIKHSDQWVDFDWKSVNQPVVFPSHDELLKMKEVEIDNLLNFKDDDSE
jgi:hypothetical protein